MNQCLYVACFKSSRLYLQMDRNRPSVDKIPHELLILICFFSVPSDIY
jgi:hypothetical protein